MTHFDGIMTILVGIVVMLGIIGGGMRYLFAQGTKRVADNVEHLSATRANTRATQDLSEAFKAFTVDSTKAISDHEHRITVLEEHEPQQGKTGA